MECPMECSSHQSDGLDKLWFTYDQSLVYAWKLHQIFIEIFKKLPLQLQGRSEETFSLQVTSDQPDEKEQVLILKEKLGELLRYIDVIQHRLFFMGIPLEYINDLITKIAVLIKAEINPVVASLGSTELKLSVFVTLLYKNRVDGKVIDFMFQLFAGNKNTTIIPWRETTNLLCKINLEKQQDLQFLTKLRQEWSTKDSTIIGAFRKDGNHCNLLVVKPHKPSGTVLVSLVEPQGGLRKEVECTEHALRIMRDTLAPTLHCIRGIPGTVNTWQISRIHRKPQLRRIHRKPQLRQKNKILQLRWIRWILRKYGLQQMKQDYPYRDFKVKTGDTWKAHVIHHPIQEDDHNCAIIVLKIAEKLIDELPGFCKSAKFSCKPKFLHHDRLNYAMRILKSNSNMPMNELTDMMRRLSLHE